MNPDSFYMRNPDVAAISGRGAYHFARAGEVFTLEDVELELLTRLVAHLTAPIAGARLLAELGASHETVETILEGLIENDLVLVGTEEELWKHVWRGQPPEPPARPCKHLVLCITGAIQAAHMLRVATRLHHGFADTLDVVLTEQAAELVQPRSFEYFGMRVWTDAFTPRGAVSVPHMELARSAQLVAICPASARSLQRLASGECSDLTSLIATATRAPVVVFPSMNHTMWTHPAVQRNVAQLRRDGVYVVEPGLGFAAVNRVQPVLEAGAAGFSEENLYGTLSVILKAASQGRP